MTMLVQVVTRPLCLALAWRDPVQYSPPMSKALPLSMLLMALALAGIGDVAAKPDLGPIPVSAGDASWGRSDAPVTMVHFSDFQCPYCSRVLPVIDDLQKKYGPGKLRVVFKHFPLPFHKQAHEAARVGVIIKSKKGDQAFWRYAREVYSQLSARNSDAVVDAAVAAGVAATVVAHNDTQLLRKRVDADIELGKSIGVRGTPATFVNGTFLSGARPVEDFVEVIDEQLAQAAKLRARGVRKSRISVELTKRNFAKPAPRPSSKKPAAKDDKTVWKVPVGTSPSKGPAHALVTLVMFSEFECPFCKRVNATLEALETKYSAELRIVFKNNPLPFHKRAEPAAQLAMEAYRRKGNKGFWAAYDKLFENQTELEDVHLETYARELGLNPTRAMTAVRLGKHRSGIEADQDLASELSATGTPQFFINGRRLRGAQPQEKFEALIDEEIAHAKALLKRGVPRAGLYAAMMKTAKSAPPPEKKVVPKPTKSTPMRGNRRAKVIIQEFGDFQCPFCGRVQQTLDKVMDNYKGRVAIAFRHRPLSFHADAPLAHAACAEAFAQGGDRAFWAMHDKLFADQRSLDRATLVAHARKLGLNVKRFTAALDSGAHEKRIDADVDIAKQAGILGTPAFTINGYFLSGAQPYAKFKKLIDRALKEAP